MVSSSSVGPRRSAQLARGRGTGEALVRRFDGAGGRLDRERDVGGGPGPGLGGFPRGGSRLLARVEREAQGLAVVALGDRFVRLLEGGVGGLELGPGVGLGAGGAGGVERALGLADFARRRLGAGDQDGRAEEHRGHGSSNRADTRHREKYIWQASPAAAGARKGSGE